jgi:hypothetical protein
MQLPKPNPKSVLLSLAWFCGTTLVATFQHLATTDPLGVALLFFLAAIGQAFLCLRRREGLVLQATALLFFTYRLYAPASWIFLGISCSLYLASYHWKAKEREERVLRRRLEELELERVGAGVPAGADAPPAAYFP